MRHLWGFGLKRSHWRAMQDKLEPYYRLVAGRDYRDRPHDAIRAFYRTLGLSQEATSQDAATLHRGDVRTVWPAQDDPLSRRASPRAGFPRAGEVGIEASPKDLSHVANGAQGDRKARQELINSDRTAIDRLFAREF